MIDKKKHSLYSTWKNTMARCYIKSHPNYKFYGAKGVKVSERWHNFDNFIYDINNIMPNGHLLYSPDYQLDKDKKGGMLYSLESCSIISTEENKKIAYTKQQRRIIAINKTDEILFHSVSEASRALNIKRPTLINYLKNGKQHPTGFHFKYYN
ncbi:NUMOD1 domain-containing DNA-binding protein [Bacillus paramycoides]|uniref:NUMOD1 domain-containing DNA-binding protein n=1 Tax=Bacillus paramycoides TaxID=2026194 RepID=UPI003805A693